MIVGWLAQDGFEARGVARMKSGVAARGLERRDRIATANGTILANACYHRSESPVIAPICDIIGSTY